MDIDLDNSMALPKSLFGKKNDKRLTESQSPFSIKTNTPNIRDTPKKDKTILGSLNSPIGQKSKR